MHFFNVYILKFVYKIYLNIINVKNQINTFYLLNNFVLCDNLDIIIIFVLY